MTQPDDELTGRAAVYGMAQTIPDKSLVSELVTGFMDVLYSTDWYRLNKIMSCSFILILRLLRAIAKLPSAEKTEPTHAWAPLHTDAVTYVWDQFVVTKKTSKIFVASIISSLLNKTVCDF